MMIQDALLAKIERDADPGPKVLIIGHSDAQRQSLSTVLRRRGYVVAAEGDAEGGIRRALSWIPQVILLDVDLPDQSAEALAEVLRRRLSPWGVKLIALDCRYDYRSAEKAIKAGFAAYLIKPVPEGELLAVVGRNSWTPRSELRQKLD
jgi:CheY-like chemotaxis protein